MWTYSEHYETLGKNRNVIILTLNLNDIILNQYRDPKLRSQLLQANMTTMSIYIDLLAIDLFYWSAKRMGILPIFLGSLTISLYRYCKEVSVNGP